MNSNNKNNIIIAAGGTGGHFFAAIAFIQKLQSNNKYKNVNFIVVTDKRCEKYIDNNATKYNKQISYKIIDIYIKQSSKLLNIFNISKAIIANYFFLKKIKPKLTIGFGGYPSFPSLFVSKYLNIPIILQEQNSFMGKTNRYFIKDAKYIACCSNNVMNLDYELYKDKIIHIGYLVRNSIKNINNSKNINSKSFSILIFGGSQGAEFFDKLIMQVIKYIDNNLDDNLDKNLKSNLKINIYQQVKTHNIEKTIKAYKQYPYILAYVKDFFHDIYDLYNKADLVISRSGASTIGELISLQKPSILIPLPSSAENHQYHNGMILDKQKASICLEQHKITNKILGDQIIKLINNPDLLQNMSNNLSKIHDSNHFDVLQKNILKLINL